MTVLPVVLALSFLPYFEARNRAANLVLAPPAENAETVSTVRPDLIVREPCPACDGRGELILQEPNFGQADGRLGKAKREKRKCPVCDGRGRTESFANPADLALRVAADHEKFVSDHQGRGEIAVGGAFVPAKLYDGADRRRLKLVEDAFGKPCSKCRWTGIEACRKCGGSGTVKCSEDDCKGGFLVTEKTTEKTYTKSGGGFGNSRNGGFRNSGTRRTTRKETKVNVQVCPTCGGARMTVCPECGGRRAKPCRSCSGIGLKQKGKSL